MLLRDGRVLWCGDNTRDALVVFLHISKTAGMSLRRLLFDVYGVDRVLELPYMSTKFIKDIDLSNIKVLCGHFHVNSHIYDQIPRPFVNFTVLRDPVARVLSEYYFYREHPEHYTLHALANRYTLEELFEQENRSFFSIFNWMCFYLSGLHVENPPLMLECAKYTLESNMTFFGFTDKLNELIDIGKHLLDWPPVELYRINPTVNKVVPSDYLISLIKQHNQLDMELYDFAKKYYEANKDFWLGKKELDIGQYKDLLERGNRRILRW
jgi:hypothetical protein